MSYQPPSAICNRCKQPFPMWSPSSYCKDCNNILRDRRKRERRRVKEGLGPLIITRCCCTKCGEEFIHNQYNKPDLGLCPTCNHKRRNLSRTKASAYRRKLRRREIYDSRVAAVKALLVKPDSDPDS